MKRLLLWLAVPLLCLAYLAGCSAKNYQVHPGAVNTFDSQTYDTLYVTEGVIEATKADLVANKFDPRVAPTVKTAINALVTAYNAADEAYMIYHAAAAAGTATQAQISTLNSAITGVNGATAALTTAKAGS